MTQRVEKKVHLFYQGWGSVFTLGCGNTRARKILFNPVAYYGGAFWARRGRLAVGFAEREVTRGPSLG